MTNTKSDFDEILSRSESNLRPLTLKDMEILERATKLWKRMQVRDLKRDIRNAYKFLKPEELKLIERHMPKLASEENVSELKELLLLVKKASFEPHVLDHLLDALKNENVRSRNPKQQKLDAILAGGQWKHMNVHDSNSSTPTPLPNIFVNVQCSDGLVYQVNAATKAKVPCLKQLEAGETFEIPFPHIVCVELFGVITNNRMDPSIRTSAIYNEIVLLAKHLDVLVLVDHIVHTQYPKSDTSGTGYSSPTPNNTGTPREIALMEPNSPGEKVDVDKAFVVKFQKGAIGIIKSIVLAAGYQNLGPAIGLFFFNHPNEDAMLMVFKLKDNTRKYVHEIAKMFKEYEASIPKHK